MVHLARGYFRRSVFKTYRFLKHPRRLKKSRVMRWFARHFLDKRVWKPTQHTLAGGMAVGWFVTVQLLPIQMPTATILAALFRVNIPIAVALCWVSNPFTIPALMWLEHTLGKWALGWFMNVPTTPLPTSLPESAGDLWLALREHAPVMFFGGLVLGGILAVVSYITTWLGWAYLARAARLAQQNKAAKTEA